VLRSKDKGSFERVVTSSLAVLAVVGGIVRDKRAFRGKGHGSY
jgi:hypothetical protein